MPATPGKSDMTQEVSVHPHISPWGCFGLYSFFIDAPEPAIVDTGTVLSPAEGMVPARGPRPQCRGGSLDSADSRPYRQHQDELAARSHRLAAAAWDEGLYDDLVVPVDMRCTARYRS
ncbi:hypothetical protein [Nocardia brevicatena]|uniref:thiolase family protein n=1 Tax=Nocardia brevicatena TaxID=37327 RepID=UPI0002DC3392